MIKRIKITSVADAEAINRYASGFDYETWVHGDGKMVDAKSLLGVISMIGHQNLRYVVPDHVNPRLAFRGLEPFTA